MELTAAEEPNGVDFSPFDLEADSGFSAAALCLHGLTGTPYEIRPVAEAIAARGIRARGPLLPGHCKTPEALALLSYQHWVACVRDEYSRLRASHERVFVVGLSLGGLLCLELAACAEPDAIAVIGAPLRLKPPIPQLIPVAKYVMPMLEKREGSDIRDPAARARHPGYPRMPLASIHELIRLQRVVAPALCRIQAPVLVAHGRHDRTADPRDAQRIHDGIPSQQKTLLWCEDSGHVVPVDYDGSVLAERIADFFVDAASRT